ncbi:MAG: hydantoinase/oxoprolinase family protein [Alphaproteobacteria bacterium]|nr:hydantoinase/oxoprolinase family protein [Alphaproteobacteria bacterium]
MGYRIGVDIGGTFTDFALYDDDGATMHTHKRLTTPSDPSEAVLSGIAALLGTAGVRVGQVAVVAHGTTLVTNAVIERTGARTGMLVTAGFADILDMGLERRYDMYDLALKFPPPLVPRALRREVTERIHYDGTIATPLDLGAARSAVADLIETQAITALAVCFLHAYANPAHEDAVGAMVAREFPQLYVSTSADVFPHMREFERWTTTTMNAFTQPMFDRYLARLESGLAQLGFDGRLLIMTSSGGVLAPDAARRYPVRMLESGPAAGVLMSAHLGRLLAVPDLIAFDMGGTTAKGALVRDFAPLKKYEMEVARVHEFKRGSGLPVKVPVIDMLEIGAGGGSLAEADERGLIRVGPRSAGADPGPACYGRGGERPTLTDANLVLGYLDPDFFLGGEMALDVAAAERSIARHVAEPLKLGVARAAFGIHEIINEDVARAFRVHAAERGFDYRKGTMIAFGGSGPIHALAIARKLRVPRVVFPPGAGVMSAFGLLVSPLAFELARSYRVYFDDLDARAFAAVFAPLIAEATGFLARAGVRAEEVRVRLLLDMRYQGQGHEVEVALPSARSPEAAFPELETLFKRVYGQAFAASPLAEPVEIIAWKVEAMTPDTVLSAGYTLAGMGEAAHPGAALKGRRRAYLGPGGGFVACPVYDRYTLRPGTALVGPALIEERESTCVIGAGERVHVDAHANLVAELAN